MSDSQESVFYKVSYVVLNEEHSGAIVNEDEPPQPGDEVAFDGRIFRVVEVMELMPPLGSFAF